MKRERSRWFRRLRKLFFLLMAILLIVGGLFAWNGLHSGWEEPEVIVTGEARPATSPGTLRVIAFNIAKCFMHRGGTSFASVEEIHARLDRIAQLIEAERADLVFLSEVVIESGPAPVNQAAYLAKQAGFPYCATGENYSFGLPFYRIRSGNALLSRLELRAKKVIQLAGRRPFWNPTNNRRILWCELKIADQWLLAASLRNDSFSLANNRVHMEEIVAWLGDRSALLAGDFNADPETPQMIALRESGRFRGVFDGPPTFPAEKPERRIDYVLAPASWELVEQRVIESDLSDHLPVLSVFRLP